MLYIICAKSCSGKDTIAKKLAKNGYEKLVSYTTRPPRKNERHGIDYYFTTEDKVKKAICLREYTVADGSVWRYWLDKNEVAHAILSSKIYICITDVKGAAELIRLGAKVIYVTCPFETRFRRYYERESRNVHPDFSEMVRRLVADENDFKELEQAASLGRVMSVENKDGNLDNVIDEIINNCFGR